MNTETERKSGDNLDPAAVAAEAGRLRHQQVVRRVVRAQLLLAGAGIALWWIIGGQREVVSFAAGAAASLASFGFLNKLTAAVGGNAVSGSAIAGSALRILLVGGALFAILQTYSLHPLAAGTGLLITVGAILVEAARGSLLCMNLG